MISGDFIPGSPSALPESIVHLVIPGRGRSEDALNLSDIGAARVDFAAQFYLNHHLAEKGGLIICTGYKTPADKNGEPWSDGQEVFQGKPEAHAMRDRLLLGKFAIQEEQIIVEAQSFDTPTNFAYTRAILPDQRPLGIVSQREQLQRIMSNIVPRIFKQPTLGVVVPELEDHVDHDTIPALIATKISMRGVKPDTPGLEELIHARSARTWEAVMTLQGLAKSQKLTRHYPLTSRN